MRQFPVVSFLTILCFSLLWVSCSSPSSTVKKQKPQKEAKASPYPAWYNTASHFKADTTGYRAYATALASDSADAGMRAAEQARAEFKTGISARLEAMRREADADNPRFILALREAENKVSVRAKVSNTHIQPNKGEAGYRAYAEVSLAKDLFAKEIGSYLSGYRSTWEKMTATDAFPDS